MSMTKNFVTLVLLILVLACAIRRTACTRFEVSTISLQAAKHLKVPLKYAMEMPIDNFLQRIHACLTILGWLLQTWLESVLEIFRWVFLLVCISTFSGFFCWGLDTLWCYHGGFKSNISFYRAPKTSTTTVDSSPVFMPLPATTKSSKQPISAGKITPYARISIVLAMPLFVVLGFLNIGVVGATAFLRVVQYGILLLWKSLSAMKAHVAQRVEYFYTSLLILYAITVALIFGSCSSISITSTKRRMTLKIKPTPTETKKGRRFAKKARLHKCTHNYRPTLIFSSTTSGATTQTDIKEVFRPILTTTIETGTLTSITTGSNTAPLLHIPTINGTVANLSFSSSMLGCGSSSSHNKSSSNRGSNNGNSSSTTGNTTTTTEAVRICLETITRAAHGSFIDQIDVVEEEESKSDDHISAVLPVGRSVVDSAIASQRKVNKLMNLNNRTPRRRQARQSRKERQKCM